MNDAIEYIEARLGEELDIRGIAQAAASSPFHFQRMFSMLTGTTVADYIRRRRMTLAAQELASTGCRVVDAALKYGYETPESFSKAFSRMHGISPSQAREPGAALKAFPRIFFRISIKGDRDMDYSIIEKEGFEIAGAARKISTRDGVNFAEVPAFWRESYSDGTCEKVCSVSGGGNIYGVCLDFAENGSDFTYMIAADAPKGELPQGFVRRKVPAATWAVFTATGPLPGSVQDVTKRIFSEWFPATGYEHDDAPELEVYLPGDNSSPDYRCEIWIPIKKK